MVTSMGIYTPQEEEEDMCEVASGLYQSYFGGITKSLTTKEEEEARNEDHEVELVVPLSQAHRKQRKKRRTVEEEDDSEETLRLTSTKEEYDEEEDEAYPRKPKKNIVEVDDSGKTLTFIRSWSALIPEKPPRRIFLRDPNALGECSEPIWKQLTKSDVDKNQCRLMLCKNEVEKMMHEIMEKTKRHDQTRTSENFGPVLAGKDGLKALVYGPDGEIHEMKFKMWGKTGNTPVLTSTVWKEFVKKYELKMLCDFLTIWMFRHKETRQICFAIDISLRCLLNKQLSARILKAAY